MWKTSQLMLGLLVAGVGLAAADRAAEAVNNAAVPVAQVPASSAVASPAAATVTAAPNDPLGLSCQPIPAVVRAHLPGLANLVGGVWVVDVVPNALADRLGLRQHDLVVAADRQPIVDGRELQARLTAVQPPVELTVIRGGAMTTLALGGRTATNVEPFPLPAHAVAVSTSTPQLSLALSSADGNRFHVDVAYVDPQEGPCRRTFQGLRQEVGLQLRQLPAAIQDQIRRQLDPMPAHQFDWFAY